MAGSMTVIRPPGSCFSGGASRNRSIACAQETTDTLPTGPRRSSRGTEPGRAWSGGSFVA